MCFRKVQQLSVKLFGSSVLFRGLKCAHGGAIKPPEEVDKVRGALAGRHEIVRIPGHTHLLTGHASLSKAIHDMALHAPQHGANEAFWGWRRERGTDL